MWRAAYCDRIILRDGNVHLVRAEGEDRVVEGMWRGVEVVHGCRRDRR